MQLGTTPHRFPRRRFRGLPALVALVLLWSLHPSWADGGAPMASRGAWALEVFVTDSCPHCANAKAALPSLAESYPDLAIEIRSLDRDPRAFSDLERYSRTAGIWPPGVPTFVLNGAVSVGFGGPQATAELIAFVERGLAGEGGAEMNPGGVVDSALFGTLSVEQLGLPLFTLALGLLDGVNPCAMWVLLFLLSMLVHLGDRSRMALIAGVFVLVSALVYYAFMAAWLNLFLAIGLSGPVRVGLGVVALFMGLVNIKDYVAFGRGLSLSIPEAAKTGLYGRVRSVIQARSLLLALASVTALAIVVNFVEVLCTAGLPALYTATLIQQGLPTATYYGYLGLYILAYMADDALMVAVAVTALQSRKLSEKSGRLLKLLSGCTMLVLGLVMLVAPELLL